MAAQKLCGKNESVVENAKPVRRLQSSPLIDACRKISTEGSEENEGCNDVASLCFLLLAQSARPALAPYPSGFTGKFLFLRCSGTCLVCSISTFSIAAFNSSYASRLFVARHMYAVACAKGSRGWGMPTNSTACCVAIASG